MKPEIRERNRSHTAKGPGVMPFRRRALNPPGTKLVRKFIRRSKREQTGYRNTYFRLTGAHFHERYPA